jgi:hypothetical protein
LLEKPSSASARIFGLCFGALRLLGLGSFCSGWLGARASLVLGLIFGCGDFAVLGLAWCSALRPDIRSSVFWVDRPMPSRDPRSRRFNQSHRASLPVQFILLLSSQLAFGVWGKTHPKDAKQWPEGRIAKLTNASAIRLCVF